MSRSRPSRAVCELVRLVAAIRGHSDPAPGRSEIDESRHASYSSNEEKTRVAGGFSSLGRFDGARHRGGYWRGAELGSHASRIHLDTPKLRVGKVISSK